MSTTYMAKPNEIERKWYIVDATGKTLGRLASEVASIIRGKHKPLFTPHIDTGDFVVLINAENFTHTNSKHFFVEGVTLCCVYLFVWG